jgi:uncharacterized protein YukJ
MLSYGFVKCTLSGKCRIKSSYLKAQHETQYHLHVTLNVPGAPGLNDVAVNVGTNDADDLLRYRLVLDYHHPLAAQLAQTADGLHELTGSTALPALDFLRSDVLAETGKWRDSDVMDGHPDKEPYASLARLLDRASNEGWTVYFFGRFWKDPPQSANFGGIHDIHMNQGSSGKFVNSGDDHNDHNDIWQDGAVIVQMPNEQWAGYFTAFTQQVVPTDDMGNESPRAHEINDDDPGSLADASGAPGGER